MATTTVSPHGTKTISLDIEGGTRWQDNLKDAEEHELAREAEMAAALLEERQREEQKIRDEFGLEDSIEDEEHAPAIPEGEAFNGQWDWNNVPTDQVQTLQHENQELKADVADLNQQLDSMTDILEAAEPVPGFNIGSLAAIIDPDPEAEEGPMYDYKMKKIAQLAKKVRTTQVKLNSEQAKNEMLTKKLAEKTIQEKDLKQKAGGDPEVTEKLKTNLKKVRKDLKHTTAQNDTLNFRVQEGERLAKKLERALKLEMGRGKDDGPLDLADVLGDKGEKRRNNRASKISTLQTKCRQLQAELRRRDKEASGSGFQSSKDSHVDVEAANRIKAMEKQRRDAVEQVTHELQEAHEVIEETQRKLTASKARVTSLVKDKRRHQQQIQHMVKKNDVDDRLIAALKDEHHKLRARLGKAERNVQQDQQELLADQRQHFDRANEQLQTQLDQKKEELLQSQLQMRRLETALEEARANGAAPRPPSGHHESSHIRVLKVENARLGELMDVFKQKLEAAHNHNDEVAAKYRAVKRRSVELEKQIGKSKIKRRAGGGNDARLDLETLREEHEQMKTSFRRQLADAQSEVRDYRSMAEEMRQQMNSAHGSRRPASSQHDEAAAAEHELLKQRYSELQQRYADLVARVQGKGSRKKHHRGGGRDRPLT